MSDFLLNLAAQIDVRQLVIKPDVLNALRSVNKSASKTITQKIKLDLDTKGLANLSQAGETLAKNLQESLTKIRVNPALIFDTKSVDGFLGRLEQIPVVLKAIKGVMTGIQANPSMIPNAQEALGQLSALRRNLQELKLEGDKSAKSYFRSKGGAGDPGDVRVEAQKQKALALEIKRQGITEENQRKAILKLVEETTRAYERQRNAANQLASRGFNVRPVTASNEQLAAAARQKVTGGVDPSTLSGDALAKALVNAKSKTKEASQALRDFNVDVKAVASGTQSGFAAIAKYSDNAFERLGGRVGVAGEKLAAYALSGAGIYSVISATQRAAVETILLEKEITNLQQIFDSGTGSLDSFGGRLDELKNKGASLKKSFFDLSIATGVSTLEIAKSAKTLAAAGFSGGKEGFDSTIRAVTLASLGPSFGNTEEVIDGLIATVNQFNLTLGQTPYILGLANEYSKAYAVEAQDLFEAIKRGGGSFSSVGGSLEDFIKLVTVSREKTREAAPVIGTFLKTLSVRLFSSKAEKIFKNLGIDASKLEGPFERLVKLSEYFAKNQLSASAKTGILSEIIDSRQVGRLASLLEGLDEFENKTKALQAAGGLSLIDKAQESIIRDATQRLDDIGPALERIKNGFTGFIEGVYNNRATRGLLSIPAGITTGLSAVGQNETAANFINPLIFSTLITGLTGVIRGVVLSYRQNGINVQMNTTALQTLTNSLEIFRATATGSAMPATAAAGAVGVAGRGRSGRGINPFLGIGLATVAPGLVNTILPSTGLSQDAQSRTSAVVGSSATGGLMGGLIFGAKGGVYGAVAGAIVGLITAELERSAINEQKERFASESRLAFGSASLDRAIKTGSPLANGRLNFEGVELNDELKKFQMLGKEAQERMGAFILDGNANSRPFASDENFEFFKSPDSQNYLDSLDKASVKINNLIKSTFIKNLGEDTAANRKRALETTAQQLSSVDIGGARFSASDIRDVLKPLAATAGPIFSAITLSITSLAEESEIAAKIIGTLTSALSRSIDIQSVGIQRFFDNFKRSSTDLETLKGVLASPFRTGSIKALDQNATSANAEQTIRALGVSPIQTVSKETQRLASIINGFISEISSSPDVQLRENIIRSLSEDRLKSIGGNQNLLENDTDTRAATTDFQTTLTVFDQIQKEFGALAELGPNSSALLELLKTGAGGSLPFDARELNKAISSKDLNSGERLLGLDEARRSLISQANILIEGQNYQLQQQIQIAETLFDVSMKRKEAEIELVKISAESADSILNIRSSLGLIGSREAQSTSIANQKLSVARQGAIGGFNLSSVQGTGDLLSLIKATQNSLLQSSQQIGLPGGNASPAQALSSVSAQIAEINSRFQSMGIGGTIGGGGQSLGLVASDLATSRALIEDAVQRFLTKTQEAFRILGQEAEHVNAKIQAQRNSLEGFIGQLFGGSGADQALTQEKVRRSGQDARTIVDSVLQTLPSFGSMGISQIETSSQIKNVLMSQLAALTSQQLNELRGFLQSVGANEFTGTNVSGEEVSAAIRGALADTVAAITGVSVGQQDVAKNVGDAQAILQKLQQEATSRIQAQTEISNTMNGNLQLINSEVTLLSQAIAQIPKEIKLVISGINDISVDFDVTKVNQSMQNVGKTVFDQIVTRLNESFRRAGIPLVESIQ